jgi:hypothetical protein
MAAVRQAGALRLAALERVVRLAMGKRRAEGFRSGSGSAEQVLPYRLAPARVLLWGRGLMLETAEVWLFLSVGIRSDELLEAVLAGATPEVEPS